MRTAVVLALKEQLLPNAQAMSDDVMYKHIDLYVNDYSVDLGTDGRRAVEVLFERARASGVIPETKEGLFLSA